MALATQGAAAQKIESGPANRKKAAAAVPATPMPAGENVFQPITLPMLDAAAAIAGITLTTEQKKLLLDNVREQRDALPAIRQLHMPNSVAPALIFDPLPANVTLPPPVPANRDISLRNQPRRPPLTSEEIRVLLANEDSLAFATLAELGGLLKLRKVTSVELTKMYLNRLKKHNPTLYFFVTLTEDRAMAQAAAADRAIASGNYISPLHGVPWGAKDLLAVKGYPTTWGAAGFESQQIDEDAEVVKRLDAAGAVLVAKTTLGALAMNDVWFGGKTRNPWNPDQGSSGSSAGSASAVAAGCLGFAIGSETLGSIASPASRCGVTGYRPTFGYVPRTGAMALSWSMDKLGPICRSAEDCAQVMDVIHGPDGHDQSARNVDFQWDQDFDWKRLRVGYFADAFDVKQPSELNTRPAASNREAMKRYTGAKNYFELRKYDSTYEKATITALQQMGVTLSPVKLPQIPWASIAPVLEAEAAAAFDELTRSGRDRALTLQGKDDWPNIFRTARFYSAVDYVQAQRARSLGIAAMAELFRTLDVIVTPTSGPQLRATNLTGHPAVIIPNGLRGADAPVPTGDDASNTAGGPGTPTSITFLGGLYDDARLLAFVRAYQLKTGFNKLHPKLYSF